MEANTEANQEEKLGRMQENIKSGQAEMRSILDAWVTDLKDGQKRRQPAKKRQRLNPIQE
jgi:hypothetical protein